jgi:hypothetical protein
MCASLPLERSWQIVPAVAAGAARRTRLSCVKTIALKKPSPISVKRRVVGTVCPEGRDTQTLQRPTSSTSTKRARPA